MGQQKSERQSHFPKIMFPKIRTWSKTSLPEIETEQGHFPEMTFLKKSGQRYSPVRISKPELDQSCPISS